MIYFGNLGMDYLIIFISIGITLLAQVLYLLHIVNIKK